MNSAAHDGIYFNTDALPERDRFPAFFEQIMRRVTGLELETDNPLGFHASLELRRVGALGISRSANAAVNAVRTARLLRDGDDMLCVVLLEKGSARYVTRDGRLYHARSGDSVVCDSAYVGSYNFTTDSQSWCVKIPRNILAERLPGIGQFSGATLDRDIAARQLLFGYLRGAFAVDLKTGSVASRLFEDHVIDLIALAAGAKGQSRELAEGRGARAARRAAVLREIERSSGDAGLSAAVVAGRLGVTSRYVHLLLEETGESFTHHVLARRLERAAVLLRDAGWRVRKIAEIAAAAGFADLSYFNRAFRRHFGATPSEIRYTAGSEL